MQSQSRGKEHPENQLWACSSIRKFTRYFFFIFFYFYFLFFIFLIKKFFQENSDPAALMREFWEDISQVAEVSSKHSSITCINYTFSGNAAEIHRTQNRNVSYPSTFFFHLSTFPPFHFFSSSSAFFYRFQLTEEEKRKYEASTTCEECSWRYSERNWKVRDHDHITGAYR